jgi:hypothetical protein
MTSLLRKKLLTTVRNELAHSELNYGELTQRGVGSVTDNRPVGRLRRKGKQHARLLPLLRRALCYVILTSAPANLLIQPTAAFAQEATVSAAELQDVPVNPFRNPSSNGSGNISSRSLEADESPLRPRQFLGGSDSASNMRPMDANSSQGTAPGVALRWRTSSKVSSASTQNPTSRQEMSMPSSRLKTSINSNAPVAAATSQGSFQPSPNNALRPSSRMPTAEMAPQAPSRNLSSSGRRIATDGNFSSDNTSQNTVAANTPWRANGPSSGKVSSASNNLRTPEGTRVISASYQDPAAAAPEATVNPPGTLLPPSSLPVTGSAPPVLPTLPPDTAASGSPTTPGNANVPPLLDPFGDRAKAKQPNSTAPGSDPLESPEPAPVPTPGSLPAFPPSIPPTNNPATPSGIVPPADPTAPTDSAPPKELPNTSPPALMPSEPQDAAPMPSDETAEAEASVEKNAAEMQESNSEEKQEISASDRDDVLSIPPQKAPEGYSCDEIRARLKTDTLDKIELDVTPRFGRGSKAPEAMEQMRGEFIASAPVRTWRDRSGRVLAQGKLKDWRRNRAILDVKGREVSFLVSDLSDTDAAYVADSWGVPHLCGLEQDDFKSRQFAPITMTWKASELMHKPLYFEEVALERYGHTAGPIWQPVISSGHFFANIAVMPYKMGIHPMTECQYALGYYRPGNCAPWQLPAVPLSGRGAFYQAKVVTGSVFLLP